MPSLKDLKIRINTVKSTQKITSAMKMVASAKLKKAQEKAESGRPYATKMSSIVSTLASKVNKGSGPKLLFGNNSDKNILIVAISADRGLCGGFNNNISKEVRRRVKELENDGKIVKLILVGRKVGSVLKREMGDKIIGSFTGIQGDNLTFTKVSPVSLQILSLFEENNVDEVEMLYNRFQSVISQVVTKKQLIPAEVSDEKIEEESQFSLFEKSDIEFIPNDNEEEVVHNMDDDYDECEDTFENDDEEIETNDRSEDVVIEELDGYDDNEVDHSSKKNDYILKRKERINNHKNNIYQEDPYHQKLAIPAFKRKNINLDEEDSLQTGKSKTIDFSEED